MSACSSRGHLIWTIVGWTGLIVYLTWNAAWLYGGQLAPSLFYAASGLPAPTTGLTRSLLALGNGDLRMSFLWNPLAIPICILYIYTLGVTAGIICGKQRTLPRSILILWAVILIAAWIAKFALGPAYW